MRAEDFLDGASNTAPMSAEDFLGPNDSGSKPPKQNTGIVGDIGTALKRGVLQMPGMATGLADIAAAPVSIATGVNRPVSRAADWLGEQTGFQPGKWAEAAGAEYSPEMQQAQRNVEEAKGFFPTLGAVAQNPRMILPVVGESLPATIAGGLVARGAMGAVAGAEKLAALRTAAGSADAAVANAARRELLKSGAIAAGVGEGAVTAGQQMAQTGYDVDPALAAGAAIGAGVGTGIIGGLSGRVAGSAIGRKLGLSDIETSMAAGTFGENAGKAGAAGYARRIGAGAIQEGLLEEAPQSYQEQVWQNLAAGKPLTEGAAEAAALGAVAGGVMGGGVNAISGPLSKAVAAAPGAGQQILPPNASTPAQETASNAGIASAAQFPQFTAPPQPVTGGAPLEQTPTDMPVPQAIQNAPAAPGSPSPVSAADPLPSAKQAEAAGAPIQTPQGPLPSANQTEVAIPPAQGPEAAALPVAAKPAKGIAAASIPSLYEILDDQSVGESGSVLHSLTSSDIGRRVARTVKAGDPNGDEKLTLLSIAEINRRLKIDSDVDHMRSDALAKTGWSAHRAMSGAELPNNSPGLQYPKQVTEGGGPLAQQAADMPLGLFGNSPKKADISPDISPDIPAKKATRIASSSGIAGALVTPQQPTFGGAPLEQSPVAMPLGEYGKRVPVASRQAPPGAPQQPLSSAGAPQARRQPQPAPIMRRDDLVGAIMRVTGGDGIASNMALTIAGDTAGRGLSKLRGLFTNRGTIDLGEVATRLREDEGFDVRDGEHLSELIRAASFGDTAVSMERAERDQDAAEEKRHRDYIRQNAKKLKIKTVAVKFTDLEQRVIAALTRRHERAVELLDERAKKRFDAVLAESYELLPEDVVDAVLVDVSGRGLSPREFWNQATETLRYMVADAKAQKEQEALNAIEGAEPDWLKDDDRRGNQPAGGREEADRVDEEARGEAGFSLAAQTPEEIAAAEAAAKEAKQAEVAAAAADARKEKAAQDKAEKDRRAAEVLKEREAAKKAEVDKAAEEFALGQVAPEPVVKKVTTEEAKGQKDIFAAPAPAAKPEPKIVEHITAKGKTLRGTIRKDLTLDQAREIDRFTFKKDGGYFIRVEPVPGQPAAEIADTPEKPNKSSEQVAKLRAAGEKVVADADQAMGRDRLTNTAKRAREASSAEAQAAQQKVIGETMIRIADAIEDGTATALSGITVRTQIELLDLIMANAIYKTDDKKGGYALTQRNKGRPFSEDDLAAVKMPGTAEWRDGAKASLTNAIAGKRGAPALRDEIIRSRAYSPELHGKVKAIISEDEIKSAVGWFAVEDITRAARLARAGITNTDQLRSAITEYSKIRAAKAETNKAKALERALVGQKVGIDFFPTPKAVAADMVRRADIQPGMSVLEPSAGNGNIAEAIQATGVKPDVVEVSSSLREILGAKGFNIVGQDFMEASGKYDRIVMNPPFSNRMDAEHVQKAYSMLNPGGKIVAIMGEGVFFGTDRKAAEFRDWLDSVGGTSDKLPAGTFSDRTLMATTGTNARLVEIEKPSDLQDSVRFSQESPQDNQPSFYSQLSSVIASARVTSQPAAQWKAWINGNAGNLGIKKDEIEWSGVNDWLDMMSGGARNAASVEKEYGADSPFAALWKSANPAKITKQQVLDYLSGNGVRVEDVVKADPYVDYLGDNLALRRGDQTKFSGYWQDSYKGGIPGTYREILVALPARGDNGFKSNHWDEPNVLVHIRTDEVIGADGKRYLRVGEIQSDWGQKGKKEGFVASSAERSAIEAEYHAANKAMMDAVDNGTAEERIAAAERSNRAVEAYNARINDATIPQAPFVTDTRAWAALGIKRAIIHAINSGVDGVVFGTGEQNANLYDLSKQVSEINYRKEGDGSFLLGLKDRQGDVLPNQSVPAEKLEETVGKEVAQRMLDGEGADIGSGLRKLSGLDLKVGGEGMRAFYDQIIPSVANDVLKKVGGGKIAAIRIDGTDYGKTGRTEEKAKYAALVTQPGFTITPQMRAKIQSQGVPLFSFAGQQSATADQFQLGRAKQLLADGANANSVRQQTGWFKNPSDGKWRYEIDDSGASLKAHGFGFGELLDALGKNLTLAEVLDHPALFAAYPSIAGSSVETIDEKSQNNGELVTNKDGGFTIRVNAGLGEAKALSVMLHEIQHGIQNVEGFASGGNIDLMAGYDEPRIKAIETRISSLLGSGKQGKEIAPEIKRLNARIAEIRKEDPYQAYRKLAGEVESRNVQQRQNFPADKRRLSDPLGTQDVAPEDVIVMFNGKDAKDAPAPFNTTRASAMAAVGASPADAAVFDMASEGKSAQEILAFLSKASRRPFNRVLAAALSRIGVASTVSIDPTAGWRNNQGRNGAKFAASYSPKTDTVALYTPREAERHVLHEFVHSATLKAIARGGPAARQMQAIFDYVQKTGTMSDQYGMGNFSRFPNETDAQFKNRALDEFTAELFTNPQFQVRLKQLPAPSGSKLKSAWDWIVRVIANLLGLKTRAQETALDRALSVGAALLQENAALTMPAVAGARYHTTWHGSPHKFYTFDLSKIGTGEGAQAYGHGLYVAEAPEVAKDYQKNLSQFSRIYGRPIVGNKNISSGARAYLLAENADLQKAIQNARDAIVRRPDNELLPPILKELESLNPEAISKSSAGNFYKVDLPAEAVARMLDWDAGLHDNPRAVKIALEKDNWDTSTPDFDMDIDVMTGEDVIRELFDQLGSKQAVSDRLLSMGIVGTRYLDKDSRDKGKGTSNFVLFDDKLARIIEVNGVETGVQPWQPGEWEATQGNERFSQEQPFSGREVAATPLKPGTTTLMVDGVERPALNSNGKPIHWSEEGVRNFWRWFSSSDAVDPWGRPLILYHFTDNDIGGTFKQAQRKARIVDKNTGNWARLAGDGIYYFTSDQDYRRSVGWGGTRFKHAVYLKLINPKLITREESDRLFIDDALEKSIKANGHDGTRSDDGVEITVFNSNQIKSATGNTGAFSPEDPDIRYSLATNWQQSPVAKEVAKAFDLASRSDKKLSWLNPVQTQYHKAERLAADGRPLFKRVFDLGQKFLNDISRFAVMAENAAPTLFHQIKSIADVRQAAGEAIRGDFGKQRNADIRAIAAPLYEGTLYGGGNPMSGVVWNESQLRQKFGLTDRQITLYQEAREAVKVSMDEMAKSLITRHAKREKVMVDSSLSLSDVADEVSNALNLRATVFKDDAEAAHDEAMQQVKDLRDAGQDKRAAAEEKIADAKLESAMKEVERIGETVKDIKAIADKANKLQEAGYFPLMRFGKHTVTAKDADGKVQHFSMHDGIPLVPRSGQIEANKLADALREENPDWTVTTGLTNPEKYKLYQGMNVDALQLFADHLDEDTRQTYQEIIRLATNERSALKRMIKREGTPGFDKDVRRTLASFILSNARYTSSSYHLSDMTKAAEDAEKDGGDIGGEAVKLVDYITKPQEEAAKIRGFLFFNFLGGSLAAAMVNATQIPMMTFPRLSQYEPAAKLAARLARVAKMAMLDPAKVPGDIGYALRRAEEDGITAPHQIYELTGTASNNIFSGSRGANAIMRAWGAPFALAESFNRRATFLASYEIAKAMTPAQLQAAGATDAYEFAAKMIAETQGIYNRGNRVNVGRGALGATVMTFKQFSIMYMEMLSRMPPKQQAIMVGMLLLAAGAGGLPFAEDAEDIIDTIGQWMGYRTNTKRTIRNALTGAIGQTAADVTMNGLMSRIGVDLHSRLGLHNILPGSALLKPSTTDKGREFQDLLGPAASVVASLGQAMQNIAEGKPDRAALALAPVAIQNAVKGAKMAATGRAEDMGGKPTITVSASEAAAKGIGFNPKAVADYGAAKRDILQDERLLDVWRERFTADIVQAVVAQDAEALQKARQAVADWNARHPDGKIAINPASIRRRVAEMRTEGPQRVLKSLTPALRQQARQELYGAQ